MPSDRQPPLPQIDAQTRGRNRVNLFTIVFLVQGFYTCPIVTVCLGNDQFRCLAVELVFQRSLTTKSKEVTGNLILQGTRRNKLICVCFYIDVLSLLADDALYQERRDAPPVRRRGALGHDCQILGPCDAAVGLPPTGVHLPGEVKPAVPCTHCTFECRAGGCGAGLAVG